MQQQEINQLVRRFFISNGCTVTTLENEEFSVELTVDMDKLLMNRPFYWHYLEKIGGEPKPMTLYMSTSVASMDNKQVEFIHFGSPRLHQIFSIIKDYGSFIRLYEQPSIQNNTNHPLHPWFNVNIKVHYQCDRKKETMHSIGVNLINGEMNQDFVQLLQTKNLTPKIPDGCYTLSGMITLKSGFKRIQTYIEKLLEDEDFNWAYDALDKMNYDLSLLDAFYEDHDEVPEIYSTEYEAIKEQYTPKITVEIINGGLFYLLGPQIF